MPLCRLRHRIDAWLTHIGIEESWRADVVLAVNEVIANALEHGSGFDPQKLVTVEAGLTQDALVVAVVDTGRWRPGVEGERADRGRGFLMIEELSDDVQIQRGPPRTMVTLTWSRDRATT